MIRLFSIFLDLNQGFMGLVNCYELKGTKHLIQSPFTTEVSIKHWITFKNYMVCESYVCLLETGLANTIWLKKKWKKEKKKTAYLNVIVLAIVKPNPVSLALPAFLVLLGEGRHPVIIYTESWKAPAMVQYGD